MWAHHGSITLDHEVIGGEGEPLLLFTGVGQMLQWPAGLCSALVEHGFRVARFDHRDAGRSTHLHHLATPSPLRLALGRGSVPYSLDDLADDAVAVLDALGWEHAHLVGAAQGGMIAQKVAVRHPGRTRSLTSISSSPSPTIGAPTPRTVLAILRVARRPVTTRDEYVRHLLDLAPLAASPAYPPDLDELREIGAACFERGHDQGGVRRLSAAFRTSGDRRRELAGVAAPTLVVHGEADRLIRPAGGRATAAAVPGARLVMFPGMGADLPRALRSTIAEEIRALAARCTMTSSDRSV